MNSPPSLSAEVIAKSFSAPNGEKGIHIEDVGKFFRACLDDGIAITGGEVWLADHQAASSGTPSPRKGQWCGLIPVVTAKTPAVFTFEVEMRRSGESQPAFTNRTVHEARAAISAFQLEREVPAQWHEFLRINFSLEKNA